MKIGRINFTTKNGSINFSGYKVTMNEVKDNIIDIIYQSSVSNLEFGNKDNINKGDVYISDIIIFNNDNKVAHFPFYLPFLGKDVISGNKQTLLKNTDNIKCSYNNNSIIVFKDPFYCYENNLYISKHPVSSDLKEKITIKVSLIKDWERIHIFFIV